MTTIQFEIPNELLKSIRRACHRKYPGHAVESVLESHFRLSLIALVTDRASALVPASSASRPVDLPGQLPMFADVPASS